MFYRQWWEKFYLLKNILSTFSLYMFSLFGYIQFGPLLVESIFCALFCVILLKEALNACITIKCATILKAKILI